MVTIIDLVHLHIWVLFNNRQRELPSLPLRYLVQRNWQQKFVPMFLDKVVAIC